MKTACLTLVMIGCAVLMHGTSSAFSPSSAPQQQSSESSTASSGTDHPTDASSAENGKRQKVGAHSGERRTRSHISDKSQSRSYASLSKANRPRPTRNGRERSTPKNGINMHQPSSSKTAGYPRIVNHRTAPVRTAGTAALGGQQFRNANNRASKMATITGSVNPARNTAEITGTSLNRRHAN